MSGAAPMSAAMLEALVAMAADPPAALISHPEPGAAKLEVAGVEVGIVKALTIRGLEARGLIFSRWRGEIHGGGLTYHLSAAGRRIGEGHG